MYRDELPGVCFTNSLVRFRAYPCLDSTFALGLFRHYFKNGVFQQTSTVTTNIAHLGAGRFAKLDVPLPPLNEQRRIVAKLEDLLARSRRAKDALDAIPPLLETLRQSILASVFRGDLTADWRAKHPEVEPAHELLKRIRVERRKKWEEAELSKMRAKGKVPGDDRWKAKYQEPEAVDASGLPELPEGWCWASVQEAGEVDLGRMRSPDKHQGKNVCPYLRVKNVYEDRIDVSDVMEMQFEPEEFEFYRLIPGDILLRRPVKITCSDRRRGARPARRESEDILSVFQGFATLPGGMDRRRDE